MNQVTVIKNVPDRINVLDYGFVELKDYQGSDYSILQAARVSTGGVASKSDKEDRGLIRYLYRNKHISPFEQATFTFHFKMPIFVARQFMRHHWSWNEYSQRYSEAIDDCYVPENFRIQGIKNHQGSGAEIETNLNEDYREEVQSSYKDNFDVYQSLLNEGVAKEQARIVMPVGNYTELYGTTNLRNILVMLGLRQHEHAQQEIRVFADAVYNILKQMDEFKWTMEIFDEDVKLDWLMQKVKNKYKDEYSKIASTLENL